jgi:hypothetical protein
VSPRWSESYTTYRHSPGGVARLTRGESHAMNDWQTAKPAMAMTHLAIQERQSRRSDGNTSLTSNAANSGSLCGDSQHGSPSFGLLGFWMYRR